MGAQERMVRVTLLRAPENESGVVTIPGGQVSPLDAIATNISINPADPAMQQPFNKDPHVEEYGRRAGPLQDIDMHQTVVYEISMNEGEHSTLMPMGIAKIQFGDLEIRPGTASPVNPRQTWEAERQRVASNWGGYALFPYARRSAGGQILADTRKIAPPRVPQVSIVEVDQRGNPIGDEVDVWKFYHWEDAVDRQAAAEAKRRMADEGFGSVGPQAVPDIAALVEAEVSKRLGKKAALSG